MRENPFFGDKKQVDDPTAWTWAGITCRISRF